MLRAIAANGLQCAVFERFDDVRATSATHENARAAGVEWQQASDVAVARVRGGRVVVVKIDEFLPLLDVSVNSQER